MTDSRACTKRWDTSYDLLLSQGKVPEAIAIERLKSVARLGTIDYAVDLSILGETSSKRQVEEKGVVLQYLRQNRESHQGINRDSEQEEPEVEEVHD